MSGRDHRPVWPATGHNGDVSCPHGFAPDQCLICRTLGVDGRTATTTTTGSRPAGGAIRPDRVDLARRDPDPAGRGGGLVTRVLLLVAALAIVAFVVWSVVGVVFALLRLLEILVVAAVAGVAGYRLGVTRGRHGH